MSTTPSTMAWSTAIGPRRSSSGSASSRWRSPASGPASPRRTVTMNRSPTKHISSPVSMSEDSLDVAQRLEHDEDAGVVELDLGPLPALDGVLDGQGVQLQLRR